MIVKCSACEHEINIPDQKVPEGKAFNVSCPKCKNKVRVDGHLKKEPVPEPNAEEESEQKPVSTDSVVPKVEEEIDTGVVVDSGFEDDETPFYGDGDKVALLLIDKQKGIWKKTLEDMDYKLQIAKSPEQAAHKMKFTQFHFVILSETFERNNLESNEGYQFLIEMPMTTRRKMFVAMVGSNFKSGNNMQAFANSVNLVINEKDVDKFSSLLKQSIIENDTFYKVYKETLTALGKI
jgi:hypothetical protein